MEQVESSSHTLYGTVIGLSGGSFPPLGATGGGILMVSQEKKKYSWGFNKDRSKGSV